MIKGSKRSLKCGFFISLLLPLSLSLSLSLFLSFNFIGRRERTKNFKLSNFSTRKLAFSFKSPSSVTVYLSFSYNSVTNLIKFLQS